MSERRNRGDEWQLGPSEDYKALLRGEITSEEYVRRLKTKVDARLRIKSGPTRRKK